MDIVTPLPRRLPHALATVVAATTILVASPLATRAAPTTGEPDGIPPVHLARSVVRTTTGDPRTIRVPVVVDRPVRLDVTSPLGAGVTRSTTYARAAGVTFVTIPVYRRPALRAAFDAGRAAPTWLQVVATDETGETELLEASIRVLPPRGYVPPSRMLTPMPGYAITSGFGARWGRLHAGVDIPAPTGTPIRAARAGVVTSVGSDYGYGLATEIDHGAYTTFYAHQSASLVHVGQRVARGQVIGRVGTSGSTTGAHLHFEVHVAGVAHDPMRWLT